MKKLFEGDAVTDKEMQALFESDYLKEIKEGENAKTELYTPPPISDLLTTNFLFTDTQAEVIKYFSKHPEMLFSLPPRKFEELIASIFENNGFDVELTPETRDGGIDIIAVRNDQLTGQTQHLSLIHI